MKYSVIIFDLDGTLIDSLEDIANSANNILSLHGFPLHPVNQYKQYIGDGVFKLVERILPADKREKAFIEKFMKAFREDYHKNCDITSTPFNGIMQLLYGLKNKGLRLAVLSNKPDELTRRCIDKMLPVECFDIIRGHLDSRPRKPNPETALEIIKQMGVQPSETVFVGDMDIDIHTALNAGFLPVGVTWGMRTKQQLTDCGAKIIIDNPEELYDIIER